nr:COX15/CtaA family protein [Paenibacillus baekrokdamisoli]
MITSRYRTLALATCIGMLLVLLAGALVTNTNSGRGCGDDFPLCNGKFIPAYTVESLIEYSHRLISGLVGLLVLATFIMTIVSYRRYREAIIYAASAGFFTVLQAVLGAIAVVWPQSSAVLALHFGISILAFTSTLLLLLWADRMRRSGGKEDRLSRPIPRSVVVLLLIALVYTYIVIYIGAFIRHTHSSGGCMGWPLCNGQLVPSLEGATLYVFIHRVAAAVLLFFIAGIWLHIKRYCSNVPELRKSANLAFILICCQVLSGAVLTATLNNSDWLVFTSILHNMIVSAFFAVLADMLIRSWKRREGRT